MEKEYIVNKLNDILQSHANEIDDLLSEGQRIVITLKRDAPPKIDVTKQIDTSGKNSKIRIIHDGISDIYPSRKALLFSICEIGCERFDNAQPRGKVIFHERPENVKDSAIEELQEEGKTWYVQLNSGINNRVSFLNKIFKKLGLNWYAERAD